LLIALGQAGPNLFIGESVSADTTHRGPRHPNGVFVRFLFGHTIFCCTCIEFENTEETGLSTSETENPNPYSGYLAEAMKLAAEPFGGVPGQSIRPFASVGIIGGGTMGIGISLACLYAGLNVRLIDSSRTALDRAVKTIEKDLTRSEKRARLSQSAASTMQKFDCASDISELGNVDIVIEAAFENLSVKQDIFSKLSRVCHPDTILGTNTSTLDIDKIASATNRREGVVGLHFFSPANIMPLLEIVRGRETCAETIASAQAFASEIGKTSVVVGNCYGFAGNRMAEGFMREATYMLLEGALPSEVDAAMVSFGMAMGPFAVADAVGLDVTFRARQENSQAAPGDEAYYRIADLLAVMGRHGIKTRRGYYKYDAEDRKPQLDPEVAKLAYDEANRLGIRQRKIDTAEIVDRCVLPIINDGFKILEEGIAARASDLDVIYTSGYGFPAWRGGPMSYAQQRGFDNILSRLREFEYRFGSEYWRSAVMLEELASSKKAIVGVTQLQGLGQ